MTVNVPRPNPLAICSPLEDRVVVRCDMHEHKTESGILLPESAASRQHVGTVVSAGPGKMRDDGTLLPMLVKRGDRVVIAGYAAMEIINPHIEQSSEYVILHQTEILATLPAVGS